MCLFDRNTKFGPFWGLKLLKRSRLSTNKALEELKRVERIHRTVIQIDLNYLYLNLLIYLI